MNIFSFEPLSAAGLLAGAFLYAASVRRLSDKGRSWSRPRSVAYFAGLFVLAIATQSPIAANDDTYFSVHVVQHLLLNMAGPILLCLGAPITLFLQAANRNIQSKMLHVLHHPVIKVVTFPAVSWLIFVVTLFVLYYSGLYELSLNNRWFHDLVHIHFILAGFLFFSPVVAIDPHPWRMPHGARLLYVGLTLPAHAFLALALISANTPLAADFYMRHTGRSLDQILFDQKLGAGIMWVSGDFIAISVVAVVALAWAKQEDRAATREDRAVDLRLAQEEALEKGLELPTTR